MSLVTFVGVGAALLVINLTGDHDALLAAGGRYASMWESFETATTGAR